MSRGSKFEVRGSGHALADYIAHAIDRLKQAGIDNPQLDARLLVGHALGLDRAALLSQSQRLLRADELELVEAAIAQREKHLSVARIIGSREFWGLAFGLNEATLEPRPDSETVIEAVMKLQPEREAALRVLDLGTGTGCLLLSLLHEYPHATGIGIDIAPRAVDQAALNAVTLGLDHRAVFHVGDWLHGLTEKFDIIVSNPPYIPAYEIGALMPDVRLHDPMLALDGGGDGLAAYRALVPQLAQVMNPQAVAVLEVGHDQAAAVAELLRQCDYINIATHKDLGGMERCVSAHMAA